jgi:hypothetical protein
VEQRSWGAGGDDGAFARPPLFRNGIEIAAMVIGFVLFWPIGLAILGYLIWRKKMAERDDMMPATVGGGVDWRAEKAQMRADLRTMKQEWKARWRGGAAGFGGVMGRTSGNAAFDDYRSEVLRRLEEERRRLDEEQRHFGDFLLRLKRAKDQEEFDRFMAERNGAPRAPDAPDAGPARD